MQLVLGLLALSCAAGLQSAEGAKYDVLSCNSFNLANNQYEQNADHGSWPASGFCRAIRNQILPVGAHYSYEALVSLYNVRGRGGVNFGHLGLAYNALDANNFDFVYFRPHSSGGCFQTGYVINGIPTFPADSVSSACPSGPPRGGAWFQAKVLVQGTKARIFLDNKLIREVSTHYRPYGRAGVIVANGYKNVIYFKNFEIKGISKSYPFPARSCMATHTLPGYYLLDADHGSWPRSGFCRTLLKPALPGSSYRVSAKFLNLIGRDGVNFGHLGLMFNAKDINNFDFVYFRPHSAGGCYQTGYVVNGVPNLSGASSGPCSGGPPSGGKWFSAHVDVIGTRGKIFLGEILVATITTHFPAKLQGGVIVANGYKNVIYFKEYKMKKLSDGLPFPSRSCRATLRGPGYYELDAAHGTWPASGFCRVLMPKSLHTKEYSVSVDLYNVVGWKGVNSGHLGLMYNAKDIDNFEFVYFRPHWVAGCYQTGYVKNGVPVFDNLAVNRPCVNGPPKGQTWFTAKVSVEGASVKIYRDNVYLSSVPTRFTPTPKGGVIVANGYQNVIYYRDFRLRPLNQPIPFLTTQCISAAQKGSGYTLHGTNGAWPGSGFCRALYDEVIAGSGYTISADFYNVRGRSSSQSSGVGHLGIMFNAKDLNNFDFIYFRPHWVNGCVQPGYVQTNVVHTTSTFPCSNGPPATGTWFNIKVVVAGSQARVYRDGVLVRTISGHFSALASGGVVVANGYDNVIEFKNFNVVKN
ncbi:uncharacterized protein LOC116613216 [Nematostella vectensis]|uniref:uncharacterized protein LOC116613216 n=2 Tax=Nematostella vectensis TaxID=45351 RepID=UPI0020777FA6|nr:uncharacterized protein LOC116613216 [Nematostella vectensis]